MATLAQSNVMEQSQGGGFRSRCGTVFNQTELVEFGS